MSVETSVDARIMARALELARRAWGATHPNPMVGAVIVEDGVVIAEGWHHQSGGPHAEIEALNALGRPVPPGASLYVTLEPCSTYGRTGACTDAILRSGIQRVVVGALDPNPEHCGRGIEVLRAAGIEVITGVLGEECADLNLIFNHWIVTGTPFIAAKMALTLDGKFGASSGHSQWITGEEARADVMRWRRYFPAVAVGGGTVLQDNPRLTSRIGETVFCPKRLILDGSLRTVQGERALDVYNDAWASSTVLVCLRSADPSLKKQAVAMGIELWELPEDGVHIDWEAFRHRLVSAGIHGLYLETGPSLATAVIEQRLVDYLFVYKAPKFMADAASPGIGSDRNTRDMTAAVALHTPRAEILGPDVFIRGHLIK